MATPKNIVRTQASAKTAGRPVGSGPLRMPPKVYVRNAPTMRTDHALAARRVEAEYQLSQLSRSTASRCCGKCKTPYNCGNSGCQCHSADRAYGTRN